MRFTITPVLFNVGINEKATIAEKLGHTAPQDRNNSDNFRKLLRMIFIFLLLTGNSAYLCRYSMNFIIIIFA